jgi:hypothetical protein
MEKCRLFSNIIILQAVQMIFVEFSLCIQQNAKNIPPVEDFNRATWLIILLPIQTEVYYLKDLIRKIRYRSYEKQ